MYNEVLRIMEGNELHVNMFKEILEIIMFFVHVPVTKNSLDEGTEPAMFTFSLNFMRSVVNHARRDTFQIFGDDARTGEEPDESRHHLLAKPLWICVTTDISVAYVSVKTPDPDRGRTGRFIIISDIGCRRHIYIARGANTRRHDDGEYVMYVKQSIILFSTHPILTPTPAPYTFKTSLRTLVLYIHYVTLR